MRNYIIFLSLMTVVTIGVLILSNKQTVQTIKYFPIDPMITFDYAETNMTLAKDNEQFEVVWDSKSKSEKRLYLRQDVALLYSNGELKGLKSKWKQEGQAIDLQETIQGNRSSFLQAISFHHGESHEDQYEIKSIQKMSEAQLYIIKQNDSTFVANKSLNNQVKSLDKQVRQDLLTHWNELIHQNHVNVNDYTLIPLTSLPAAYNKDTIPLPEEYSEQIIGQLWEGLYKNYVLPTIEGNQDSYVPIILFANDETHLLVLFDIEGRSEKLIQKYPSE